MTAQVFTESEILAALRRRFTESGNGGSGRYAVLTHVRTGAAFEAQEIDAVAFCLWPSDQHALMAFEVKVSRSDWLHEIKPDMSKSARARSICDSFTVVCPEGVIREGELPDGWGHLVAYRGVDDGVRLRHKHSPRPQRAACDPIPDHITRSFLSALLRAANTVPGMTTGRKRDAVARVEEGTEGI